MEETPQEPEEETRPPPLTDRDVQILLTLYDNAGEVMNTRIIVFWMVNTIFFVVNPTALFFLVSELIKGTRSPLLTLAFLGGLLLNYAWRSFILLERKAVTLLMGKMGDLEDRLRPVEWVFGGGFSDLMKTLLLVYTTRILQLIVLGVMFVWLTLGLYSGPKVFFPIKRTTVQEQQYIPPQDSAVKVKPKSSGKFKEEQNEHKRYEQCSTVALPRMETSNMFCGLSFSWGRIWIMETLGCPT